jgi:hypothetical protein
VLNAREFESRIVAKEPSQQGGIPDFGQSLVDLAIVRTPDMRDF